MICPRFIQTTKPKRPTTGRSAKEMMSSGQIMGPGGALAPLVSTLKDTMSRRVPFA